MGFVRATLSWFGGVVSGSRAISDWGDFVAVRGVVVDDWRRRAGLGVIAGGLLLAFAWSVSAAAAARPVWTRIGSIRGVEASQIAFDRRDVPWVVVQRPRPGGWEIAALTERGRLSRQRLLPRPPGKEVFGIPQLLVNAKDEGYVELADRPVGSGSEKLPPEEVAVASWNPGHPLGAPIQLAGNLFSAPSTALAANGTLVVASTNVSGNTVFTRFRGDHVTGKQELASGPNTVYLVEVAARQAGGFFASWATRRESNFEMYGVDAAFGSPAGVFGAANETEWPAREMRPALSAYESLFLSEGQMFSNGNGAQVVLWTVAKEGLEGARLYAASRQAGQPFGRPQDLGETSGPQAAEQAVITPSGRVTILWPHSNSKALFATEGKAGQPFGRSEPVTHTYAVLDGYEPPRLALTSRGKLIAAWGLGDAIETATSTDGLHFSHLTVLEPECPHPPPHGPESLVLSPDRQGGAIAAWTCHPQRNHAVQEFARYHP